MATLTTYEQNILISLFDGNYYSPRELTAEYIELIDKSKNTTFTKDILINITDNLKDLDSEFKKFYKVCLCGK